MSDSDVCILAPIAVNPTDTQPRTNIEGDRNRISYTFSIVHNRFEYISFFGCYYFVRRLRQYFSGYLCSRKYRIARTLGFMALFGSTTPDERTDTGGEHQLRYYFIVMSAFKIN